MESTFIIHIDGPTGSGKTTLMQKLLDTYKFNTDVLIIDLDDIDDVNSSKILEDSKYDSLFKVEKMNDFFKVKEKLNEVSINNILTTVKENNIYLILLGLVFNDTINDPSKYAKHKFFIDIDSLTCFKRLNKRTLNSIYNQKAEIETLFDDNSNNNPVKTESILIHKHKIRVPFLFEEKHLKKNIELDTKRAKEKKYTISNVDTIEQEIYTLIPYTNLYINHDNNSNKKSKTSK